MERGASVFLKNQKCVFLNIKKYDVNFSNFVLDMY